MAKSKTVYYSGIMMVLGAVALAVVSLSFQRSTTDTRSRASNVGNQFVAEGEVDSVNNGWCQVKGWAIDMDAPQESAKVKVYLDKPYHENPNENGVFLGDYLANLVREDVNKNLKIGGNHGFQIDLYSHSQMPKDGKAHKLFVYAAEASGSSQYRLLEGGEASITCRAK